ncbi:drebrin-like protein B isoform X3 [Ostrea edulis]|uniref:drebrin-like protein B isoform X3 n=1 Tax=Ostrea edulis TaxID=37623 RepID=UPI0024AE97B9|nr:drebrin-like protein B isoform X3 [Ostrea edulis]
MAIDLRKNKDALLKAYNDVVDDKSSTDWMVMGYEGQTAILKLVGSGDGGIEEMTEDLNSSKIMYAYCKVLDPNTSLFKYVLINWQGEAAPESMKFKCTSHLRDVAAFLRGVHVTVNARTEEDVDSDDIIKKVAKASGANYSIHQEKPKATPQKPAKNAKKEDSPGPVGSVYQRTIAAKDINSRARDKFWADTEKEEQRRLEQEKQRRSKEQQELDRERREREAHEAQERDKIVNDKLRAAREQKVRERRASEIERDEQKKRWTDETSEQQQQEAFKEEEERGRRSEAVRKERAAEAVRLTSSSTANARALFKRRESETDDHVSRAPPPPRKLQHNFFNQQQEEAPKKQPIQLPRENPPKPGRSFAEPEPSGPSFSPRQPSPPPREPSPPRQPSPPPREPSPPPREPSPPPREPSPPPKAPSPQLPRARNLLAEGLPPRQDSDEENNNDDDWGEDNAEEPHIPAVQSHLPPPDEDQFSAPPPDEDQNTQEMHTQNGDVHTDPDQQQVREKYGLQPEHGLCAVALYDYQAADESEISFDPEDVITNIDLIDEGWWTGMAPNGHYGMFPANYVEMIQ